MRGPGNEAICWLNNGNTLPPALCAGEVPDEKLKINELGPYGTYKKSVILICMSGIATALSLNHNNGIIYK